MILCAFNHQLHLNATVAIFDLLLLRQQFAYGFRMMIVIWDRFYANKIYAHYICKHYITAKTYSYDEGCVYAKYNASAYTNANAYAKTGMHTNAYAYRLALFLTKTLPHLFKQLQLAHLHSVSRLKIDPQ